MQLLFSGVAQGVVTGIRGLCNGLGPALFGLIFYLFHVDLNEATDIDDKLNIKAHIKTNQTPEVRPGLTTKDVSELFSLPVVKIIIFPCTPVKTIRIYHESEGRIEKPVPLDHRLASQGLPSDDKLWSRGMDFSILLPLE